MVLILNVMFMVFKKIILKGFMNLFIILHLNLFIIIQHLVILYLRINQNFICLKFYFYISIIAQILRLYFLFWSLNKIKIEISVIYMIKFFNLLKLILV